MERREETTPETTFREWDSDTGPRGGSVRTEKGGVDPSPERRNSRGGYGSPRSRRPQSLLGCGVRRREG